LFVLDSGSRKSSSTGISSVQSVSVPVGVFLFIVGYRVVLWVAVGLALASSLRPECSSADKNREANRALTAIIVRIPAQFSRPGLFRVAHHP